MQCSNSVLLHIITQHNKPCTHLSLIINVTVNRSSKSYVGYIHASSAPHSAVHSHCSLLAAVAAHLGHALRADLLHALLATLQQQHTEVRNSFTYYTGTLQIYIYTYLHVVCMVDIMYNYSCIPWQTQITQG